MNRLQLRRSSVMTVLLATFATTLLSSSHSTLALSGSTAASATGVVGMGFWAAVSCIACISAFLIGSGATFAGLAVFLAANPEIAILCVANCEAAAK